jgi:hypothetical protein
MAVGSGPRGASGDWQVGEWVIALSDSANGRLRQRRNHPIAKSQSVVHSIANAIAIRPISQLLNGGRLGAARRIR